MSECLEGAKPGQVDDIPPGVPAVLLPDVQAALAKAPADRPAASGLVEQLAPLLAAVGGQPVVSPAATALDQVITQAWTLPLPTADNTWPAPTTLTPRGRRWWLAAVGAASAAIAAAVTLALLPNGQAPRPTLGAAASHSPRAGVQVTAGGSVSASSAASPSNPAVGRPVAASGACIQVTNVMGTSVIQSGACLVNKDTPWATATTGYNAAGGPAYQCSATIDRTQDDAGGQPLKVCQPLYPDTRLTFLAVVTAESGGSTTACPTQEAGA